MTKVTVRKPIRADGTVTSFFMRTYIFVAFGRYLCYTGYGNAEKLEKSDNILVDVLE